MKKLFTIAFMALAMSVQWANALTVTTFYTTPDGAFEFECYYDAGDYEIGISSVNLTYALDDGKLTYPSSVYVEFLNYDGAGNDLKTTISEYFVTALDNTDPLFYEVEEIDFGKTTYIPNNYFVVANPLESHTSPTKLKKVRINKEVTQIEDKAFAYNENLETVEFEEGIAITKIRDYTFVAAIEDMGFGDYETYGSLKNFIIPASVNVICEGAFQGQTNLGTVTIPEYVITIEESAFNDCHIDKLVFDKAVPSVTGTPFKNCEIGSVIFNGKPNDYGGGIIYYIAGADDRLLKEATGNFDVSFSPADGKWEAIIFGESSFEESEVLAVNLPETFVPTMGAYPYCLGIFQNAFANTYSLIQMDLRAATPNFVNIGEGAFQYSGLNRIFLPNTVNMIGEGAFESSHLTGKLTIPAMIDPNTGDPIAVSMGSYCFASTNYLDTVVFECAINQSSPYQVNTLPEHILANSAVKHVDLPSSLNSIGEGAFHGSKIKKIKLPASVNSMGESVFENCIDLESADLGETGITILPENTFYGDQKLTSAVIPAGMDKWEAYSFYDTGFKTLTVTCANLAGLAISMCPNLETVSFDNSSLTSLKKHSLYQLPKLKEIDFGKYITKLEEKSIYDCQTFDSLVVTENMKSIDQSALFYPTTGGLKTVMFKAKDFTALADYSDAPFEGKEIKLYIDPSVKNIPAYTFAGTQITNSVEITDEQVYDATAFYGAFLYNIDWHYPTITSSPFKSASVENLTFSDITEIPDYLWSGCYISNIWLDGIEKIGDYAFESTDLDNYNRSYTLTIPASVKEIGEYAFGENNSSNLTFEKGTGLTIGKEAFSKTGYYNNIRTNYTKDNIPTAAADAFKTGSDCEIVFAGTCDDVTAYQSADGWKDIKTKKWDGVSSFNVDYELVGAHFPRDKYKLLNYMIHLNGGSVAYTPFGCSNTGELSFDDDYCDLVFDNWPDETTDKNSYKPVITSDTIIKIYVHENVFDVNLSLSNPATEDVAKIKTANYYKYFNDEEVPVENTSIKVNSCMEGEAVAVLELSDEEHYNFDGWYDEFSMPLTSDYELGPLTIKGNYIARVEPYNYSLYVVHDPSCVNCELKTNDIKISGISEGIWGGSELLPYKTKAEIEFIGAKSSSARYLLDHWADYTTGEEISKDNPYEVTVLGYTQIYPVIKAASQYAITAVSSDDKLGTAVLTPIADAEVEPAGSKIYWEKSKIHLKALEKDAHYHFVEWQASPSGKKYSTSDVDVEVDGSATSYLAVFKKDTFTVSVTVSGIDPSLVEIMGAGKQGWGDETTLSCTIKDTHYHFVSWTSGLTTTTDPTLKLTVKDDMTVSVTIAPNDYTITTVADPIAGGTITGGGSYAYKTKIDLEATAFDGYRFYSWTDDDKATAKRSVEVLEDATYTAKFDKIVYYTVTVASADDDMGSVTGGGTVEAGENVTITATPKDHYRFVQWSDGDKNATRTFAPTKTETLVAKFEAIMFTITTKTNNDAMGTVTGGGSLQEGATATLTVTPKEHYRFVQWSDGDKNNPRSFTVTEDATYTAEFEAIMFTITTKVNDEDMGTVTGGGSLQEGATATLTATPKEHYRFVQWKENENTNNTISFTVTKDTTLTAEFEAIMFTITVAANDDDMGTVTGGGSLQEGATTTLTATPKDGYEFVEWNDGDKNATRIVTVAEDKTFTATFKKIIIYYTITGKSANDEQGTVTGGGKYEEGAEVKLYAAPKEGYKFVRWDNGSTDNPLTITATEDATYTAEFATTVVKNYNITVNVKDDKMGTATGTGEYPENTVISIEAKPNTGYKFTKWTDGNTDAKRSVTVTGDATYTAEFEALQFTIIVNVNDDAMGEVDGGGTYNYGKEITITATPKEGYEFVGWNDGDKNANRGITVTEDKTYTATFKKTIVYYTITVKSANDVQGTVTGGGKYEEDTEVELTATPAEGYKFVRWDNGSTDNPLTITATEDKTYTAEFAAKQFIITVNTNDEAMGDVDGGGTYDYGKEITLTATPKEGYEFVEWNDGDKNATRTVTVAEDKTYTATFKKSIVYYNIEVKSDNEEMGIVTGGGKYEAGAEVKLYAVPKEGYKFVRWSNGSTDNPLIFTAGDNAVFTAFFEKIAVVPTTYSITVVSADEDMGTVYGGGKILAGENTTIGALAKDGYKFLQWNDGNTDNPRIVKAEKDAVYTALFAKKDAKTYKITAQASAETMGVVTGGGEYAENTVATLMATANSGYHFVRWTDGDTSNPRKVTVTKDETFIAEFAANGGELTKYTITALSSDEEMGSVSGGGEYEDGQVATLVALATDGYRFVEWNDGVKDNPRYVTVTTNATYTARFEEIPVVEKEFFVTAISSDEEMGKVLGGGTYKSGATANLVAIPNDGYKFVRWSDGNTNNPRAVTVDDNLIFVAQFKKEGSEEKPTYTISISSNDESMGTVSDAGQHTVEEGTVFVLKATAKVGHHFVRWEDNSTEMNRVITVTGNHNYIAYFEKNNPVVNKYIITVSSANDAQGYTEGSGVYDENQVIIIKAIAKEGYEFKEWNDGNKEAIRMVTVTANAKYVASFQEKKVYHVVNIVSANPEQGSVTGSGIYEEGKTIEISAVPATGYHFVQWSDGNTDNPRTITVDGDITLVATFGLGNGIYNIEGQESGVRKVMIDGHIYIITPNGEMYDAVGRLQ